MSEIEMARTKKSGSQAPEIVHSPQTSIPQEVTIVQQAAAQLADMPPAYGEFLADLKSQISSAQLRAALAANRELVLLYWSIGRQILDRQNQQGWGAKVIDRLAADLRMSFPTLRGFSPRNLKYMRSLAQAYSESSFVEQFVACIPWMHNCVLLDKVKEYQEREWYIRQTIQQGWSRAVLVHQIELGLYERQGQAQTNFARTLPPPQSDLAREALKDPYTFDFLTLSADAAERDLQGGLLDHLRNFLLELGVGFAFVGSRYHLEVADRDYYLDLLFYHLRLRCFVVIELKVHEFEPEHAGKMNFYLSVVDDLLKHPGDQPSIGLILCKDKDRVIVEYALRDTSKPMSVATYVLRRDALPEALRQELPSIDRLESELQRVKPQED
jgi:predicted nuclease of restriction endonuclease-like (RecB) superfamily